MNDPNDHMDIANAGHERTQDEGMDMATRESGKEEQGGMMEHVAGAPTSKPGATDSGDSPVGDDADTPAMVIEGADSDDMSRAVRVAALPPERLPQQDRSVILHEARIRILEAKELALSRGEQASVEATAALRPPGKWKKRFKRMGWAIGGSLVLAIFGVTMMLASGDTGLTTMKDVLNKSWIPALFARLLVYAAIAWWGWPILMRSAKAQAFARLKALHDELLAENPIDHYAVEAVEHQMRKAAETRVSGVLVFVFLLIVELIFIQVPYLLAQ